MVFVDFVVVDLIGLTGPDDDEPFSTNVFQTRSARWKRWIVFDTDDSTNYRITPRPR